MSKYRMAARPGLSMRFHLAAAILCLSSVWTSVSAICVQKPSSQPLTKPFPNVPNTFRATYARNMLTVNTSLFVEEIFSEDLNIGVMWIENLVGPAIRTKLFTYADTNEFILIPDYDGSYGGNCTVGKLSSNDFAFPFKVIDGHEALVSGKDVLFMGDTASSMRYLGTDYIDDIDVDVWNACLFKLDSDLTMNATYYFTLNTTDASKKWQSASTLSSTIKRIEMVTEDSTGAIVAQTTYQYSYFSDNIPMGTPEEMAYYEPPLGSYCEGRVAKKPLPSVPDYFSFYMEVHDPQKNMLTYTDEWYDFTINLTRMDHNILEDRTNVSLPATVIHDYQTGLTYNIAKYTGECYVNAIVADSFDNEVIPASGGLLRIRNPKEFFDFDNPKYPWIYEGTHVVRGVECEVWISKRPYPTEDSNIQAYWEWYFTNSQWVISTGDVLENLEPFRMVITVPDSNNQATEFSIYNFNQEPPKERYFDISKCFDQHNESRSYEFVMRADVERFSLDVHIGMLRYWTMAAIEAYAGVRSIRVHDVQFQFDGMRVFTRFTLLGMPTVQGDVPNPVTQLTLEEAEQFLTDAISHEQFLIYYLLEDGKSTQFQVLNNTLVRMEYTRDNNQSIYYIIDDEIQHPVTHHGIQHSVTHHGIQHNVTPHGIQHNVTPHGIQHSVTRHGMQLNVTPHAEGEDYVTRNVIVTSPPTYIDPDVTGGGVAAIVIVLLIVGVALVAVPFYFLSVRRKNLDTFNRSQLTMIEVSSS